MPFIEVRTVEGGTVLEAQGTIFDLLSVRGAGMKWAGGDTEALAHIVTAGVLAGELSLCSRLMAWSLSKSYVSEPKTRRRWRKGEMFLSSYRIALRLLY